MKTILTSGTAIALSSVVETQDIDKISALIIQIIIGIITIIKLLKSEKNANNQKRPDSEGTEETEKINLYTEGYLRHPSVNRPLRQSHTVQNKSEAS